jgi:hypothetical protein
MTKSREQSEASYSTSRAEVMAEEFANLYYYNANGERVSAGSNPIKAECFLAGMKAMLDEAEKMARERPFGDGTERLVLLSSLKKLMETNLKPAQGTEQEVGELWDSEDQE